MIGGILAPAVVFLAAHLATAAVCAWPAVFSVWAADNADRIDPSAVLVCLYGIVLVLSMGRSPGRFVKNALRRMSTLTGAGRAASAVFVIAMLLPQRVMDDNSGYVMIPSDSPLLSWLTLLDVARGVASFGIAGRVLEYLDRNDASQRSMERDHGVPRPRRRYAALGVGTALLGTILALSIQFGVLGNIPHVDDEIIQDWQARLLATQRVRAPDNPAGESFTYDAKLGFNGRYLFSTYQPAMAVIWSGISGLAAAGCVNPFLFLLVLLLCRRATAATAGTCRADLVVLLLGVSPFAILMAGGRMNHLLALLLVAAVWRALPIALTADRPGAVAAGAMLAGLSAGIAFMTRRPDAVALLAASIAAVTLAPVKINRKQYIILSISVLTGICLFLQTGFVHAHVGDASQLVWQVRDAARGAVDLGMTQLLANVTDTVLGFSAYAWGGILAGWPGLIWLWITVLNGCRARRSGEGNATFASAGQRVAEQFLAFQAALTVVGYSAYYFQDFCYGPRYFFGLLPAAAYGWSGILETLMKKGDERPVWQWLRLTAAFALLMVANQIFAHVGTSFWHIDTRFQSFLSRLPAGPRLIFLRHPARVRLEVARRLAARGIDRETIASAVSPDAIDYDLLRDELDELPASASRDALKSLLSERVGAASTASPEQFAVNPWEVVRLNGCDPLSQKTVIALDKGDTANERLRALLPDHAPALAVSGPGGFRLASYTLSGLASFDR